MAMTVHCDIVSAEEELFSGLVEMVVAHGNMGDLGILPGHTPLLTDLKPGPVRVIKQDRSEEHTSELQSRPHLVCRLLLEKKKNKKKKTKSKATQTKHHKTDQHH